MNFIPEIKILDGKKLIGLKVEMSLLADTTRELFTTFMPQLSRLGLKSAADVYDLRLFPKNFYNSFDAAAMFTKAALIEFDEDITYPPSFQIMVVPRGMYAVFTYAGPSEGNEIFAFIFSEWLPKSIYELDNRPHFDVLKPRGIGANEDQKIHIPIKLSLQNLN